MSKESGDFSHIVDELNGQRVVRREDGSVLIHYGDINDADDPRWFVADKDVAEDLLYDLTDEVGSFLKG